MLTIAKFIHTKTDRQTDIVTNRAAITAKNK